MRPVAQVRDAPLQAARIRQEQMGLRLAVATLFAVVMLTFVGGWSASIVVTAEPWSSVLSAAFVLALGIPAVAVTHLRMTGLMRDAQSEAEAAARLLDEDSRHRDFESTLADALEMSGDETDALRVVERSFHVISPGRGTELLLADNSHAHMARVAFTAPAGDPPGCQVASPQDCPAARRGRTQYFPDSEAINACPHLEGRSVGACSGLCIPVSIMGRTVGVIHAVGHQGEAPDPGRQHDLHSVANQVGNRLAIMRIMAETQVQASTDALTGLMNRRAFENRYRTVRTDSEHAAVAMADLDHFKELNDTYGHDTGDRALRIFAETLRQGLRAQDLVARHGGEEFAVFFPACDAASAMAGLRRVQVQLQAALRAAGLPAYTVSFGVVEAREDEDLNAMLIRADAALFAAKAAGRDRVVVHDAAGVEMFQPAAAGI